jgi:hypothetical protein
MNCGEAKWLLSPYLDGQVSGMEMHSLRHHMKECGRCQRRYASLERTQQLLVGLGSQRAPADLPLRLRVAISREAARARRSRLEGVRVRLENALNAFMVPATAGLVSAVVIFGLLLGFFALPVQLRASSDVPLFFYIAPQLEQSVFGTALGSIGEDSVVIEAYVDANGRVQDYRILTAPENAAAVLPQVKNLLIFTTFRPALSMGRPTAGRAVISFSKISVKG